MNKIRNIRIESIGNGFLFSSDLIETLKDNKMFYPNKEELLKAIEKDLRGLN